MKPKCYKTLSNRWHRVDSVVVKFKEIGNEFKDLLSKSFDLLTKLEWD
jgi:hypothetical protein